MNDPTHVPRFVIYAKHLRAAGYPFAPLPIPEPPQPAAA